MAMPSPDPPLTAVMAVIRRQAPALIGFSLLANLLLLVSAIYMLQVYDRVLSSSSLDTLVWLTVMALTAIAIYGLLEQARRLILGRIGTWLESELSGAVIRRAMAARLAGTGVEAGLKDVADLRGFIAGDGILAFLDAPWTPIFIAFIWLAHPALGGLATIGALVLFLAALANDLLTRAQQQTATASLRRSQLAAQQYVDGAETLSPLGMTGTILAQWQEQQRRISSEQRRLAEMTAAILNASRAVRLALQIMILGLGAYYVLEGQLTSGGMIAASIILSRALAPIERSIGAWRRMVDARAARRNLARLFEALPPEAGSVRLPRPSGRLVVQNLHYAAPRSGDPILRNLSFDIEPGRTCAIIGPSGSGKSTLCRLLVGAWKPSHGHVRLDGAEIFAWDPEDLGQYLGYLPQQVELFPGTVAENIARLGPVDSAKVIVAAQLAGVHEMILRLPAGYETDVGQHGGRISLGQRQRLGLARALFGEPSLIVLDEPNSNLDSEGDQALIRALAHLKQQGRTVLIVTHQTAALQAADKILMLAEGTVAAFGDRDTVLATIASGRRRTVAASAIAGPAELTPVVRPTLVSSE
ncbi:type I secretion system permease/ATPase [Mycobacterium sp. KBS0706]|uniref:type I secretion system permease/ATPase n=1 Tax=Mycobacterium sp. KBS0706 TaxID=2578109 RepID=UPI001C8F9A49|nr:type I secretion system permease/ATPase [Mycobacterium sp. KBS0706]